MIAWLVETLIVTTALMLLVLAIREPVRRMFGAKVAYALWLLPMLRMVMPPLGALVPQASPLAEVAHAPGMLSQIIRARMVPLDGGAAMVGAGPGDAATMAWPLVLAGLWLAGALAFALWQVVSYRRFCRHVLEGARPRRSPARGIRLMASPRVKGPMAFGLARRFIIFPHDAHARFDVEEHAMALAHEIAHHRRGDLLANAFALAMLALHWCNPVAWLAHRAFRADQEMACDADVIGAIRDRGLGQAYGRALVKCASGREFSAICHLTTVDRLKRRLTMLSRQSPSAPRRLAGLALAGMVVLSGLALTASGEGMAAQVGATVSEALPIPRQQAMRPSPPAVPALAAVGAVRQDADAARPVTHEDHADGLTMPPAPPAPPVAVSPPVPPAPPAGATRMRIAARDLRMDTAMVRIPTAAEIEAMVPVVEVTEGRNCAGQREPVETREERLSVGGHIRQKISVTICNRNVARHARAEAVRGLQQARADIARTQAISERMRGRVMTDLDRQIADLRRAPD